MVLQNIQLLWLFLLHLAVFNTFINIGCINGVSGDTTGTCTVNSKLNKSNRDGKLPIFPLKEDLRVKSSYIYKAHEIIYNGLKQFLNLDDAELGVYLSRIINQSNNKTHFDEYGEVFSSYHELFSNIWEQYNETLCENYAIKQFEKDRLDLCSASQFLSHQPGVKDAGKIMKRMRKALKYRCDPCMPYKRNEKSTEVTSITTIINGNNESPDDNGNVCKDPSITENYGECKYSNGFVGCEMVPFMEIQKAFRRTPSSTLDKVLIVIKPSERKIPENFLGVKKTSNLILVYSAPENNDNNSPPKKLKINANALRSTKNYTKLIEMINFDSSELDLSFLSGFNQLNNLSFINVWNVHRSLPTLPELPNLILFDCRYCSGLGEITNFPTLINGLKYIAFLPIDDYEKSADETIDRLLNWILISSANTLQYITIERYKELTKIPKQIPLFKALKYLQLQHNGISVIRSGSLNFSVPVTFLSFQDNQIESIEPGAFQGDFKNAFVDLNQNNLKRFQASVFQKMIQEAGSDGGVNAVQNQIDCSGANICHLAWLIRDERRKLDKNVFGACSNGTSFTRLRLSGFDRC